MIRLLTIEDVPRIAEIEQQEQIVPLTAKTLHQWFTEGYVGWGLVDGDYLYGYTIAKIEGVHAYSTITCIAKLYQNKKEGRELCWHALQEAKKLGVEKVTFEVRRSNVQELSMVKHFGAYVVGEKPGYYPNGEDALVMNIDLKELKSES